MRLHRFYVKQPLGEELVVEKNTEEGKALIHQWLSVFRYKESDTVSLFSESVPGKDFLYTIVSVDKNMITLKKAGEAGNVPLTPRLTLAMALVKKDTFETIARQATELGVSTIAPVQMARSEKKNLSYERLGKITTEAAEQSGMGAVPKVLEIQTIEYLIKKYDVAKHIFGSLRTSNPTPHTQGGQLVIWVGPEGGFTEEEETYLISSGATPISLGEGILRADTAAISLVTLAKTM